MRSFDTCYNISLISVMPILNFLHGTLSPFQQGWFSTWRYSGKRLFGPLRQKVSISFAERRASSQKNEGCRIEIQFEGGRREILVAPFGATQKRPADCRPADSTAAFWPTKVRTKWCTFFILRCTWKRLEEPNQPYYSHEAQLPEELTARSDSLSHVAHQNPSPGSVESSPLYSHFDFALTHSVSQWRARVTHYLVCPCVI